MTAKTFSFAGLELRCVTVEGNPWFVAADVCRAIGLTNPSMSLKSLNTADRAKKNLGASQPVNVINETGLYTLVLRAQKGNPKAREFQNWVTSTVLPAIRQTGGYIQGEEKLATGEMTEEQFFALAVLKANVTMERLRADNAEKQVVIEEQAKVIREEIEHGTIREFSSKANLYLTQGQSIRMGQFAAAYCRVKGLPLRKKMMKKGDQMVPVNVYPREAFDHARLLVM